MLHHDLNASSVFDGTELEHDISKKDVNLFVSHLEISKHDLGLDGSGFIENIFKHEMNMNYVSKLNTSSCLNSAPKEQQPENKLLNAESQPPLLLQFFQSYKLYVIVVLIVIIAICIILAIKVYK